MNVQKDQYGGQEFLTIWNTSYNCVGSCQVHRPKQRHEQLRTTVMPGRPWQKVAVDLCVLKGRHFLVVVDYFSRFIEIAYQDILESTTYIYSEKKTYWRDGDP